MDREIEEMEFGVLAYPPSPRLGRLGETKADTPSLRR